jgi:hypothetical protein
MKKIEKLKELGFIDDAEFEKKAERIAKTPFVKYEVSALVPN